MYTFKNKQAVHKFTPTLALKTYKISKARLMIYNSKLVPVKYYFMAPIHPKMVELEPWCGWYKQVSGHAWTTVQTSNIGATNKHF